MRLTADGRRVKQQLRAHQRHAARALGEPLIPADTDANLGVAGLPDLEAGVAGVEVVLLVVTGAIGDMALAIDTQVAAIGIDDRNGIETRAPTQLEEADRQHHCQLLGQRLKVLDCRVVFNPRSQLQILRVRLLAEIRGLEQLLNQDDLRALGGGLAHQFFGLRNVGLAIPGAAHLGGGNGHGTGHGSLRLELDKNRFIAGQYALGKR